MGNLTRVLCAKCGNVLSCENNGVIVVTAGGSVARADLYACNSCTPRYEVIKGLGGWLDHEAAKRTIAWTAENRPDDLYDFRP